MRSLLLFFLINLLILILSIIPLVFIVIKIGLFFMTLLLTGFHLILPHVLGQSPSVVLFHLSLSNLSRGVPQDAVLSPLLFTSLYTAFLALSSPRIRPNITCMLMTPSNTFLQFLHSTFVTVCQKRYHQSLADKDGIIDGDKIFVFGKDCL